jgi:hypothetical protein
MSEQIQKPEKKKQERKKPQPFTVTIKEILEEKLKK